MEQELSTLPEQLNSFPFLVGSCYSIFNFLSTIIFGPFFFSLPSFKLRLLITLWYIQIFSLSLLCMHEHAHLNVILFCNLMDSNTYIQNHKVDYSQKPTIRIYMYLTTHVRHKYQYMYTSYKQKNIFLWLDCIDFNLKKLFFIVSKLIQLACLQLHLFLCE